MFKLAIICGGPSPERGISLNSTRSILDHIPRDLISIHPLYVDFKRDFYSLSTANLYSNTPADFDFKLEKIAKKLDKKELFQFLKEVDLVFPVIHGSFGEDGELQSILEAWDIPYVGSGSLSCSKMFQKHLARDFLKEHDFSIMPMLVLSKKQHNIRAQITDFFTTHHLIRAIVKPSSGGSSIGVSSVSSPQEALEKCQALLSAETDHVVIEPFCSGTEFTVVIFENQCGDPIALVPTEIEVSYENNQIFDFRKKYLPTNHAAYHTPPRFSESIIQKIRKESEELFKLFEMRDFVRIDGWVMPDNTLYFTDFNPLSGLEQNSFLFRQAAVLGLTHQQTLLYILKSACRRYGLTFPSIELKKEGNQRPIYVLFGGDNAERQVSLMSGTNVWLKIMQSERFDPIPMLYDRNELIWKLPYSYTLNHTVEEIYNNCISAESIAQKLNPLEKLIQNKLGISFEPQSFPEKMPLDQFFTTAKKNNAFVFIAMHGGKGENGTLQSMLEAHGIPYNGSNANVSFLCMDKYLTGQAIAQANHPEIFSLTKKTFKLADTQNYVSQQYSAFWESACQELNTRKLIIKPQHDGCSAGIILLQSAQDFERYCSFIHKEEPFFPANAFTNQNAPIEMPSLHSKEFLLEPYISTDLITIQKHTLNHVSNEGWVELTVGVLEENGVYHALSPSIAVADGAILTLEDKFQGGTGINITPPPPEIISLNATEKIKRLIEYTAKILGIQNYARIDIFFNRISEKIIVIEANTLPGLTPSTVIYHQGLSESPPLTPRDFLEKIIDSKLICYQKTTG